MYRAHHHTFLFSTYPWVPYPGTFYLDPGIDHIWHLLDWAASGCRIKACRSQCGPPACSSCGILFQYTVRRYESTPPTSSCGAIPHVIIHICLSHSLRPHVVVFLTVKYAVRFLQIISFAVATACFDIEKRDQKSWTMLLASLNTLLFSRFPRCLTSAIWPDGRQK